VHERVVAVDVRAARHHVDPAVMKPGKIQVARRIDGEPAEIDRGIERVIQRSKPRRSS